MNAPVQPAVPTVRTGMRVEVSPDETMATTYFGFVCNDNGGQPDIIAFPFSENNAQFYPFRSCVHVNDPRLESVKNEIRQDEFRGVFRIAEGETSQQRLTKAHVDIEQSQLEMGKQIFALMGSKDDLQDRVEVLEEIARRTGALAAAPAKRGRGKRST